MVTMIADGLLLRTFLTLMVHIHCLNTVQSIFTLAYIPNCVPDVVVFDNSFSWINSKKVVYNIQVLPPYNINDLKRSASFTSLDDSEVMLLTRLWLWYLLFRNDQLKPVIFILLWQVITHFKTVVYAWCNQFKPCNFLLVLMLLLQLCRLANNKYPQVWLFIHEQVVNRFYMIPQLYVMWYMVNDTIRWFLTC